MQKIVNWAKDYASLNGKQYVRLDTVGNNEKLIQHYARSGFTFLGLFNLKVTNGLPEHYQQDGVSLFELPINK